MCGWDAQGDARQRHHLEQRQCDRAGWWRHRDRHARSGRRGQGLALHDARGAGAMRRARWVLVALVGLTAAAAVHFASASSLTVSTQKLVGYKTCTLEGSTS